MGRTLRSIAYDAKKRKKERQKKQFKSNASAERQYYRQLKKVAEAAAHIVERHAEGADVKNPKIMMQELQTYSEQLTPWAERQAGRMLNSVNQKTKTAYRNNSATMAELLQSEVANSDVGMTAASLLFEQVTYIKSIPVEAGLRAQDIAYKNFLEGMRAVPDQSVIDQLVNEMKFTKEVAVNRAKLIARTETAKANASFVQSRASALGVTHYIWRTTMDGAERKSHAKMNGRKVAYDKPPDLKDGTTGHAGNFPNCRCWQDPIIPE